MASKHEDILVRPSDFYGGRKQINDLNGIIDLVSG